MDELISALGYVGQEKFSFVKLRELQLIIQENMKNWREKLWILYPLDEIIEDFFYTLEGVDLSNNSELKKELGMFRSLFADLGESFKSKNLTEQTECMNKIIESYINIAVLS